MDSPFFAVLITDIIFIAFALGLNKKNAKYLLSGYNTMSEKERENFDIENYLILFKKFFYRYCEEVSISLKNKVLAQIN